MSKVWTDGCNTFEDRDAAFEDACCEMTWDDVEDYFANNMTFHEFFTRVKDKMGGEFFELFENEWCDAENEYFNENYWEEEQDEEGED